MFRKIVSIHHDLHLPARGDEDGGDDKERHGDKCHVELPLPLLFKVNPALGPVVLGLCRVVEVEDGRGKCSAEDPGDYD